MDPDQAAESPAPQQLLTMVEAVALLRTPVATLRYWRHRGIGPDGFPLGRRVVYLCEDLDRRVLSRRNAEVRR